MRRPGLTGVALHAAIVATLATTACGERKTAPVAIAAKPDSADQVLFGVQTILQDKGLRRAELVADTAKMFDETTRTELRTVRVTFYTQTGAKNGTLTSRQGTYNSRVGNMEARGNVVVVSTDGRRLETPQLRYDPARNEVSSDSAFVLTEGTKRVSGVGFVSDPNLNTIRILRRSAAAGAQITIPKK